ncbi:hypothetical protein ACTFIV_008412 [Dictyostelium citrinum]
MIYKKVAIIGAGPSGLCFAKYINQIGFLVPTIFDKSNDFGGVWSNSSNRKVWDSLRINFNQFSTSFSDFQFRDSFPTKNEIFPTNQALYDYYKSYVEHFNLLKYIRFNSKIQSVKKYKELGDDFNNCKWIVTWVQNDHTTYSEVFDYIVIATGTFSKGFVPKDLQMKLNNFKGDIIHSENYRNPESLKGKNVVVVGSSFSGCEIANEVSTVTSKCIQVGHENYYAVNSFIPNEKGIEMPWEMIFHKRDLSYHIHHNKTPKEIWESKKKFLLDICPKQDLSKNPNSLVPVKTTPENQPPIGIIISRNYIENVETGKIKTYTGDNYKIISINGNSVTFSNEKGDINTEHNIDAVVLSSGFQIDFSFLENDVLDDICYEPTDSLVPMCLYEHTFPSKFKTIAFLGCLKGVFRFEVELYCRWVSLVFSGKLEYPNEEKLIQGKNDLLKLRSIRPRPQFPILVDCVYHSDKIAKEIGCLPDFEAIKINDPDLYNKLWNGFFCQASYNLSGPFSNPTIAKEIINNYYENYQQFINLKKK